MSPLLLISGRVHRSERRRRPPWRDSGGGGGGARSQRSYIDPIGSGSVKEGTVVVKKIQF